MKNRGSDSALLRGLSRYLDPRRLERLAAARIGVAGAGGLGSQAALMLARSGLRSFRIADFDCVDASNLGRQAYFPEDIGCAKVDALARHIRRLDSGCVVEALRLTLREGNAATVFDGCTAVIEALDSAPAKAMLYAALADGSRPYVGASGIAGWGGPPLTSRRLKENVFLVGDFVSDIADLPPLAPRVIQAAAMQADIILSLILGTGENHAHP